jgi:hypothetical protein
MYDTPRKDAGEDEVAAGELILGYENEGHRESHQMPVSPHLEHDGVVEDFGRNGSYLVFRQLRQSCPAAVLGSGSGSRRLIRRRG